MLRIVAGKHRGRALVAPAGQTTRPTAARTREALFNILAHAALTPDGRSPLPGARVLDAFAGSGALGIEALSRGAAHATFMDPEPAAIRAIGDNLRKLGEAGAATVLRVDAARPPPAAAPCTLALLDPPYRSGLAGPSLLALHQAGWLAPGAVVSVEVAAKEDLDPPAGFEALDERRYGAAKIVLLRLA